MPEVLTDRSTCHKCHKNDETKKKLSKCKGCHAITYCGQECQTEDWPRHSDNCIPVMVTEIPGKGRGLVAARDLKMGELIFYEKAVMTVDMLYENGKLSNETIDSMQKKIKEMSEEDKSQFLKLKYDEDLNYNLNQTFKYLSISARDSLDGINIYYYNSLIDDCKMLFLTVALMNHSCAPNSAKSMLTSDSEEKCELRAIRDIPKGEEITIFYLRPAEGVCTISQIRGILLERFGFSCKCKVCSGEVPHQDDLKRKVLEILQPTYPSIVPRPKNPYRMSQAEWGKMALDMEKVVDSDEEIYIGSYEAKSKSCTSLAGMAQLAREKDLLRKAMDVFKKLAEDSGFEKMRMEFETLETSIERYSKQFKSKKSPKRKEIDHFYQIPKYVK